MRILLLGDYSNVHATLAKALRAEGHNVTLASDGDGWKNYDRDVDLHRSASGCLSDARWLARLLKCFCGFRGYDVVQLVNPVFLPLRAERIWPFYRYLRRHNKSVFLGAFGMDHYYVKACVETKAFRYSDFNIGDKKRTYSENDTWIADWLHGPKGELNKRMAADVDGIVTGLYEYDASYRPFYADKTRFIPFPIALPAQVNEPYRPDRPMRIFVGIQERRSAYKGTDLLQRALRRLAAEQPAQVEAVEAVSLPFDEYVKRLQTADVLLDQIYSYTPAMNALEAMAHGMAVVSGGEPENYTLLGCHDLRPIVNVPPTEEGAYEMLRQLVANRAELPRLQRESREYIERYHDSRLVAQAYVEFWTSHGAGPQTHATE